MSLFQQYHLTHLNHNQFENQLENQLEQQVENQVENQVEDFWFYQIQIKILK